jgi:hypothetical protein
LAPPLPRAAAAGLAVGDDGAVAARASVRGAADDGAAAAAVAQDPDLEKVAQDLKDVYEYAKEISEHAKEKEAREAKLAEVRRRLRALAQAKRPQ